MGQVNIFVENHHLFYWLQDFTYFLDILKRKYNINYHHQTTSDYLIFRCHLPDFYVNKFKKDLKKILKLFEKKSTYKNYFSQEVIKIKLPFKSHNE